MNTPTIRLSRATNLATVAFATLLFTTAPATTREAWPQRFEADWLLAEEVAAQNQLGGRNIAQVIENAKAGELNLEVADLARIRKDAIALGEPIIG